jgi:hypothetical protein
VREPCFMAFRETNNPALKRLDEKCQHPSKERSNLFKDASNFEDYISVSGR